MWKSNTSQGNGTLVSPYIRLTCVLCSPLACTQLLPGFAMNFRCKNQHIVQDLEQLPSPSAPAGQRSKYFCYSVEQCGIKKFVLLGKRDTL